MALAEDEHPVQGFVTQSLDRALAMGIGSRASEGRKDDPSAVGAEYLVELANELDIPIVDDELEPSLELVQLPAQVSGLLCDPGGVGMGGAVGVENSAPADLQEDEQVESPK